MFIIFSFYHHLLLNYYSILCISAAEVIYENVDVDANIIFGALVDDKITTGEVSITVLATGFATDFFEGSEEEESFSKKQGRGGAAVSRQDLVTKPRQSSANSLRYASEMVEEKPKLEVNNRGIAANEEIAASASQQGLFGKAGVAAKRDVDDAVDESGSDEQVRERRSRNKSKASDSNKEKKRGIFGFIRNLFR